MFEIKPQYPSYVKIGECPNRRRFMGQVASFVVLYDSYRFMEKDTKPELWKRQC